MQRSAGSRFGGKYPALRLLNGNNRVQGAAGHSRLPPPNMISSQLGTDARRPFFDERRGASGPAGFSCSASSGSATSGSDSLPSSTGAGRSLAWVAIQSASPVARTAAAVADRSSVGSSAGVSDAVSDAGPAGASL